MSTNEENNNYQQYSDMEERVKNAEPRYLTEGKKRYLLASSQESLQALQENQNNELTRVLISLKSEHDQLTLETNQIKSLLAEYEKRIEMIQSADEASKAYEEKQKQESEFMENGINSKKQRKNEEEFTQKSLLKQKEKLNKDLFIIQKEIIQCENESQNLDKKAERCAINENIIKEKKNQVFSKIESQKQKNKMEQNENDLKIKQYKKMIKLKKQFLQFADDRKDIQNQIAQKAKNDSLDKQEVEKRKTLKLLMLYNQYLRTLMEEQLKENEGLEKIFEEIRDICGTNDLNEIVDFILLRNKRYNYACQEVSESEKKNKKLKKEIKSLKQELVELKNKLLVQEKEKEGGSQELDVELSTNPEEDLEIIEKEKQKNKNLLLLGKSYNQFDSAYQSVLQNLSTMIENEKKNPLNVKLEDENQNETEEIELTNDEIQNYKDIAFDKKEKAELDNYNLNEEENTFAKNVELTEIELSRMERNQLGFLEKIKRRNEEEINFTDEEKEIMDQILSIELTADDKKKLKEMKLTEEEEYVAVCKPKVDYELSQEERDKRIEEFKELKLKFRKYKIKENKEIAKYKLLKKKKKKMEIIQNYELLLKKVMKTFDELYLIHSKQEFLNLMKEKGYDTNNEAGRAKGRKTTNKAGTRRVKKFTNHSMANKHYSKTEVYKINESNEENDNDNEDLDAKILKKFIKEQKKEKENFISGKIKIVVDDKK